MTTGHGHRALPRRRHPLTGPDPHDWFVDILERGMIGDNWCAGSDLFDHPRDHDMEILHRSYALYHEDMPAAERERGLGNLWNEAHE